MKMIIRKGSQKSDEPRVFKCCHCSTIFKTDEYRVDSDFYRELFYGTVCPVCKNARAYEKIVGCVGGYSDTVHPNGVDNWGLHPNFRMYEQGFIPAMHMSIDCLKGSGCVRLMFRDNALKCCEFIGVSDFYFYLTGEKV